MCEWGLDFYPIYENESDIWRMRWCHCGMATCRFMVSKKSGSSQFFVRKKYCDSVICFWGSDHHGNGWFLQFYTYFNSYFFSCFFFKWLLLLWFLLLLLLSFHFICSFSLPPLSPFFSPFPSHHYYFWNENSKIE